MCGFFGIFGSSVRCVDSKREMLISKSLRHRGPDDFQVWNEPNYKIMFWRLSIVDQVGGKQPMISIDQKKKILFNGEIYNYRSLRAQLKIEGVAFKTDSDTEVILSSYERWGIDCFSHFEGMFAVCIIDEKKNKIILARDRLGVKPLYYKSHSDGLAIASEQKALLAETDDSPKLDRVGFLDYLVFQTVMGTRTLFKDISKVPPGYIFEFDFNTQKLLSIEKIKAVSISQSAKTYDEYRIQARECILEQTRLTLDTDLPICFHLSGGLDSNMLIALCRFLDPKREFVCISSLVDGENDPEWDYIKKSAEYHGSSLKLATITQKSFFSVFEDVIYYLDEPVGDPGVVAQFLVNKLASGESKIVFSGQGFDEMFFGYVRDLAAYVLSSFAPNALVINSEEFDGLHKNTKKFLSGWEAFLSPLTVEPPLSPEMAILRKLCRFDPFAINKGQGDQFSRSLRDVALDAFVLLKEKSTSLHEFMIQAETGIQLPSLLHMEDRASMRYSLETRVPFCTASILDVAKTSKLEWKFYNGQPKGILRDIFSDIIPPHILNRKQKIGRPIPFQKWLSEFGGGIYIDELKQKRELFFDLMKIDFVEYAMNQKNPYDRSLWAAVSLSKWIDIYNVTI